MGDKTGIQWTDATWNPTRGCRRISPGCENCYAERQAHRMSTGAYKGLTVLGTNGPRWTGKGRLAVDLLDQPLRWTKPRRVFVDSMSDLFFEGFSDHEIAAVFAIMARAKKHTFQVLTKRAGRMRRWFESVQAWGPAEVMKIGLGLVRPDCGPPFDFTWPLPNVWLGVSVENQKYADERIPELLATPAAVRFVSYEPALGPVNFRGHVLSPALTAECVCGHGHGFTRCPYTGGISNSCHHDGCACPGFVRKSGISLDWIIVGGESGPNARAFDLEWARSTVDQCKAAGVACFVKQLGSEPYDSQRLIMVATPAGGEDIKRKDPTPPGWMARVSTGEILGKALNGNTIALKHKKGGDMEEWPEALRIRQFPEVRA